MESRQEQRRKRLLVLGAGPAQLGLLVEARRRDLHVVAADRDPGAPGFRYADRRAIVSAEDEPAIERLARAENVDGLIAPGIDWAVAIAARVAHRLGVDHPLDPETALLATSKPRQRACLGRHGVPQPRSKLVSEPDDELGYPCVVKAPDRQGQRGLTLVREAFELPAAVSEAIGASRGGNALIEELVEGPEVTVNGFSLDGVFVPLTVTDRLTAAPPAFGVALAHVWPSAQAVEDAVAVAARAVEALGIRNGPSYTQLRLGPDGAQVIELAARLGGGHDAELCRAALGVNMNGLALSLALGEQVEEGAARPDAQVGGACVRFLVAPVGQLRSVEGIEDALRVEGIEAAGAYRRPPWHFGELRRGSDRAGFVLATGDSAEAALRSADRAAERIRFRMADAEAFV